jgi:hypothetical protein
MCYHRCVTKPADLPAADDAPPPARLPRKLHPAPTEDRLRVCARLLAKTKALTTRGLVIH